MIKGLLKQIVKRIFCKHAYKELCRVSAASVLTNEKTTLEITYKCVKCGKEIVINTDTGEYTL